MNIYSIYSPIIAHNGCEIKLISSFGCTQFLPHCGLSSELTQAGNYIEAEQAIEHTIEHLNLLASEWPKWHRLLIRRARIRVLAVIESPQMSF